MTEKLRSILTSMVRGVFSGEEAVTTLLEEAQNLGDVAIRETPPVFLLEDQYLTQLY